MSSGRGANIVGLWVVEESTGGERLVDRPGRTDVSGEGVVCKMYRYLIFSSPHSRGEKVRYGFTR